MQTARGEHARGARAITVTILAIATQATITTLLGLKRQNLQLYEEINYKNVRRSMDPLLASRVLP